MEFLDYMPFIGAGAIAAMYIEYRMKNNHFRKALDTIEEGISDDDSLEQALDTHQELNQLKARFIISKNNEIRCEELMSELEYKIPQMGNDFKAKVKSTHGRIKEISHLYSELRQSIDPAY